MRNMQKIKKYLSYLLYLVVFLMPLQTRYIFSQGMLNGSLWEYNTLSIFVIEILVLILIIGTFVVHLIDFDDELHFRNQTVVNIFVLLSIFLLIGVVASFFALDIKVALLSSLRLFEGIALVFVLMHSQFSLHRLAQVFVASSLIQSIIGIYQFFAQSFPSSTLFGISEKISSVSGISVVETASQRFLRAYGTLPHPNILSAYLVVALIFTLVLLFTFRSNREKIFLYSSSIILSAGLFFTLSRSAFIVYGASLFIIVLYLIVNKNKALLQSFLSFFVLSVCTIIILGSLNFDVIESRFFSTDIITSSSVQERSLIYNMSRNMTTMNWQKGVGLNNYTLSASQLVQELDQRYYEPVHNVYVLIVSELGVGGLFIFVLILFESLKHIWRLKIDYSTSLLQELEKFQKGDFYEKEYAYSIHWYIGFSGLFIGMLIWFLFDHFFWTLVPGILLWWFIFGLYLRQFVRIKR